MLILIAFFLVCVSGALQLFILKRPMIGVTVAPSGEVGMSDVDLDNLGMQFGLEAIEAAVCVVLVCIGFAMVYRLVEGDIEGRMKLQIYRIGAVVCLLCGYYGLNMLYSQKKGSAVLSLGYVKRHIVRKFE